DKKYLDAVTKCADFLMKMHDDQYGGYYNRVLPDLKGIDDTKTGYTSFAIFPLAHAYMATNDPKYKAAAMQAWAEGRNQMEDGPFFENSSTRDFSGPAPMNSGGPGRRGPSTAAPPAGAAARGGGFAARRHGLNVHMFEALLALYQATHDQGVWKEITEEMAIM